MVNAAKEKLVIILILTLALGQLVRIPIEYQGLQSIYITPFDLIAVILVTLWIMSRPNLAQAELAQPIAIFAGLALLSLVVNARNLLPNELIASSLYFFRWLMLTSLYFIVKDFTLQFKKRLLGWLALSGMLVVLAGIIQYFFYPDLRNLYYAGWDEHLYRVFSTFLDPNFVGAFFVLNFILMLVLALHTRSVAWKFRILVIGAVLTLVAILLTYSRSAYAMFFVTNIMLLLLTKKKMLLIFMAVFIIGIILLPKNLPGEGVNLARTASVAARQQSMERAVKIWQDHPLFGIGFNAYRYAQKQYGFLPEDNWQTLHSAAGTDNSFLFVASTTGTVGLLSFFYLCYSILRITWRQKQRQISQVVLVSVVGILVNSLFINSLFFESILAWIWILVGIREKN